VVAAILYTAVGRREFKPSGFGKANTLAQIMAVAAVLLSQTNHATWVIWLRSIALDATVVLTIASGLHYAWLITRRANAPGTAGPPNNGSGR
jgi:cardiolipin synthase